MSGDSCFGMVRTVNAVGAVSSACTGLASGTLCVVGIASTACTAIAPGTLGAVSAIGAAYTGVTTDTLSAVSTDGCLATTSILWRIWLRVAINACSFNGQPGKHTDGRPFW
jgi:hypothetical protein